jgi:ABC-type transport system involved in multi-copper enzyme maturation permease subunit
MFRRVAAIAANSYRESVRARILHGLFGLAIATAGYALVVGAYALQDMLRVVSDLGAASVSLYALIAAVVIGATSLYREIELKTVFPILARPIERWEYVVGKFIGSWMTLAVFVLTNTAVLQSAIAALAGQSPLCVLGAWGGAFVLLGVGMWSLPRWRSYLLVPWALCVFLAGCWLARTAPADNQVLATSALLTLCEVAVVSAISLLLAAFSSPFLTAVLTFGLVVVGRSADSLTHLPPRVFGSAVAKAAAVIGKAVPNLMIYLPPRGLLVGEVTSISVAKYVIRSGAYAVGWCAVLLICASALFSRRDFQ